MKISSPTISTISISSIQYAVLYFPVSYFLWKRQLPPPVSPPIIPPWSLFPCPRRKKMTSTSHLKWDRRLPNKSVSCGGINDPIMDYSAHVVTSELGIGVPHSSHGAPHTSHDAKHTSHSATYMPHSDLNMPNVSQYCFSLGKS